MIRKLTDKYRGLSPALRTSIWFTICNFLQRGTAFITVPVFTRLLTTDQYGLYNIYLSWFEVFVLFASLKIPYEGLNNGLIRHEDDKDGYTSAMAGLMTALAFLFGLFYLIFRRWIDHFTGLSQFVMLLMFLEILFNPPLYLWTNRERFDFRYRMPVLVTMASTILTPAIAIIAVLNTSYKAEARIMATVAVQAVTGLILYAVIMKKGKKFYDREYWRFALGFNIPLIFYYLSQSLLNQSDRIMINYFNGTGKAGIYSVAYSAASIMLLFVSAINGSFNPWMYKQLKAGKRESVGKASSYICSMLALITLGMVLFAPDLIRLLATKEYYEAIYVIPPVAASVFFIFLYMVFANVEMYLGETGYISMISIISSAANLILNAIFIRIYGYLAAGWTTLVCYMLLAVLHFVLMKKACRIHLGGQILFHEKFLLVLSFLLCLISTLMLFVYPYTILRWGLILVILLIIFLQRKRIFDLIRTMKEKG